MICCCALLPVLSSCLIQWDPFDEEEFVTDYANQLCDIYLDCQDGIRDFQWVSDANSLTEMTETCQSWAWGPFGACTIDSDASIACYDQLQQLSQELASADSCEALWNENALHECYPIYPSCELDTPFGTIPPMAIDPPVLTQMHPRNGNEAGGTPVTLSGGIFDTSTEVFFNQQPAAIDSLTDTALSITTGPATSPGTVDIIATNSGGETQVKNAFTFWSDRTGKSGIFGAYIHQQYLGSYWTSKPSNTLNGAMWFIDTTSDPSRDQMTTYLMHDAISGLDQCTTTPLSNDPIRPTTYGILPIRDTDYPEVVLSPSTSTDPDLPLFLYEDGLYASQLEEETNYPFNRRYDLVAEATTDWPELDISNVVTTPAELELDSPLLDSFNKAAIDRMNFHIRWSGLAGDYVEISVVQRYGSTVLTTLFCAAVDDGDFTIDPDHWKTWAASQELMITVCRAKQGEGIFPTNGGRSSLTGMHCVTGLGTPSTLPSE